MCPICMHMMNDAFLTACGHSFCYMCIITHLRNKNDCPCCGRHLTNGQLFPNFILDKLLKKASARQISKSVSHVGQFRRALQQGCEVSVKEVDTLMFLLCEKKRRMEQEEAEKSMQVLLDFLHCLRKRKTDELNEIQADLQYIREDISVVERHRMELLRARDRYSVKLRVLGDDPTTKYGPSAIDRSSGDLSSGSRSPLIGLAAGIFLNNVDEKAQVSTRGLQRKDALSGLDSQHISQSGLAVMKKKRIHAQFNELQECYLQKRRQLANSVQREEERNANLARKEGYSVGLADFQAMLSTFTSYSQFVYEEHEKRAWSVDFSPTEPSMLVSGSDDCKVKVWCTKQEASVLNIDMKANICCIKYNPGSNYYVAVGSADHHIHYYDLRNISQPVHVFGGHRKAVSYVKFLSSYEIASASTDSTRRLWDVKESCPARTFRGHAKEKNFVGLSVN